MLLELFIDDSEDGDVPLGKTSFPLSHWAVIDQIAEQKNVCVASKI